MRTRGFMWLVALALLGCEDGQQVCRAICTDMIEINVARDAWPDGAYELETSFAHSEEGVVARHVCAFTLPGGDPVECQVPEAELVMHRTTDGMRVFITDAPESVEVRLKGPDGAERSENVKPEYRMLVCGQDCASARVDIEL